MAQPSKAYVQRYFMTSPEELPCPGEWPKKFPYRAIRADERFFENVLKSLSIPVPTIRNSDEPDKARGSDLVIEALYEKADKFFFRTAYGIPFGADPFETKEEIYILLETYGKEYNVDQVTKVLKLMGATEDDIVPIRVLN